MFEWIHFGSHRGPISISNIQTANDSVSFEIKNRTKKIMEDVQVQGTIARVDEEKPATMRQDFTRIGAGLVASCKMMLPRPTLPGAHLRLSISWKGSEGGSPFQFNI